MLVTKKHPRTAYSRSQSGTALKLPRHVVHIFAIVVICIVSSLVGISMYDWKALVADSTQLSTLSEHAYSQHPQQRSTVIKGTKVSAELAADVPALPAHSAQDHDITDLGKNLKEKSISVYRIIGNDMPPFSTHGFHLKSLEYTLKNEATYPWLRKRFVLNRVVHDRAIVQILRLLESYGYTSEDVIRLPFDMQEYSDAASLDNAEEYSNRMKYVLNFQHVRQVIINDAQRSGTDWMMILDGCDFIPNEMWKNIIPNIKATEDVSVDAMTGGTPFLNFIGIRGLRLRTEQHSSWLNSETTMDELTHRRKVGHVQNAPVSMLFRPEGVRFKRLEAEEKNVLANPVAALALMLDSEVVQHYCPTASSTCAIVSGYIRLYTYPDLTACDEAQNYKCHDIYSEDVDVSRKALQIQVKRSWDWFALQLRYLLQQCREREFERCDGVNGFPFPFGVYRVLGNDLPPLRRIGQQMHNLKYILQNEPEFFYTEKYWILNRVSNAHASQELRNLVQAFGHAEDRILIREFDMDAFVRLGPRQENWDRKMSYAVNPNAARNMGIQHAYRRGITWVVVLDGSQMLTAESWYTMWKFLADAKESEKIGLLHTYRLSEEQDLAWLHGDTMIRNARARASVVRSRLPGLAVKSTVLRDMADGDYGAEEQKFFQEQFLYGAQDFNTAQLEWVKEVCARFTTCVDLADGAAVYRLYSFPSICDSRDTIYYDEEQCGRFFSKDNQDRAEVTSRVASVSVTHYIEALEKEAEVYKKTHSLVGVHHNAPSTHEDEIASAPPLVVYRVIGNDVSPLNRQGSSIRALRFILTQETASPFVERRFVLNGIYDGHEKRRIISMLQKEFNVADEDIIDAPADMRMLREQLRRAPTQSAQQDIAHRHLLNPNIGRNAALADAKSRHDDWVLILDTHQFLTDESTTQIRLRLASDVGSASVAMVTGYRTILPSDFRNLNASSHINKMRNADVVLPSLSMLMFHMQNVQSPKVFDETVPYSGFGHSMKVAYEKLCPPGDQNTCIRAGYVVRLFPDTELCNDESPAADECHVLLDSSAKVRNSKRVALLKKSVVTLLEAVQAIEQPEDVIEDNQDADEEDFKQQKTTIVLYRVITNDLPPLESPGNVQRLLHYVLENEPIMKGVIERRWVLYRLFDDQLKASLTTALTDYGADPDDIIDVPLDYDDLLEMTSLDDQAIYMNSIPEVTRLIYQSELERAEESLQPELKRWLIVSHVSVMGTQPGFSNLLRRLDGCSFEGSHRAPSPEVLAIPTYRLLHKQDPKWFDGNSYTHQNEPGSVAPEAGTMVVNSHPETLRKMFDAFPSPVPYYDPTFAKTGALVATVCRNSEHRELDQCGKGGALFRLFSNPFLCDKAGYKEYSEEACANVTDYLSRATPRDKAHELTYRLASRKSAVELMNSIDDYVQHHKRKVSKVHLTMVYIIMPEQEYVMTHRDLIETYMPYINTHSAGGSKCSRAAHFLLFRLPRIQQIAVKELLKAYGVSDGHIHVREIELAVLSELGEKARVRYFGDTDAARTVAIKDVAPKLYIDEVLMQEAKPYVFPLLLNEVPLDSLPLEHLCKKVIDASTDTAPVKLLSLSATRMIPRPTLLAPGSSHVTPKSLDIDATIRGNVDESDVLMVPTNAKFGVRVDALSLIGSAFNGTALAAKCSSGNFCFKGGKIFKVYPSKWPVCNSSSVLYDFEACNRLAGKGHVVVNTIKTLTELSLLRTRDDAVSRLRNLAPALAEGITPPPTAPLSKRIGKCVIYRMVPSFEPASVLGLSGESVLVVLDSILHMEPNVPEVVGCVYRFVMHHSLLSDELFLTVQSHIYKRGYSVLIVDFNIEDYMAVHDDREHYVVNPAAWHKAALEDAVEYDWAFLLDPYTFVPLASWREIMLTLSGNGDKHGMVIPVSTSPVLTPNSPVVYPSFSGFLLHMRAPDAVVQTWTEPVFAVNMNKLEATGALLDAVSTHATLKQKTAKGAVVMDAVTSLYIDSSVADFRSAVCTKDTKCVTAELGNHYHSIPLRLLPCRSGDFSCMGSVLSPMSSLLETRNALVSRAIDLASKRDDVQTHLSSLHDAMLFGDVLPTNDTLTVVRIIGADVPPLYGAGYGQLSLRHILKYEKIPTHRARRVHRVFVLYRIPDADANEKLLQELDGAGYSVSKGNVIVFPFEESVALSLSRPEREAYFLNPHVAMNLVLDELYTNIIEKASDAMSKNASHWVLPLYGAYLLPEHTYEQLSGTIDRVSNMEKTYISVRVMQSIQYRENWPNATSDSITEDDIGKLVWPTTSTVTVRLNALRTSHIKFDESVQWDRQVVDKSNTLMNQVCAANVRHQTGCVSCPKEAILFSMFPLSDTCRTKSPRYDRDRCEQLLYGEHSYSRNKEMRSLLREGVLGLLNAVSPPDEAVTEAGDLLTVSIYHIFGPDLPPMQSSGAALTYLQHVLTYQPPALDVDSNVAFRHYWVLNRVEAGSRFYSVLIGMLKEAGVNVGTSVIRLPYKSSQYFELNDFDDKVLYFANPSHGRNAAVRHAVQQTSANWALLLDGPQTFSENDFGTLAAEIRRADSLGKEFFTLPSSRIVLPKGETWQEESTDSLIEKGDTIMEPSVFGFYMDRSLPLTDRGEYVRSHLEPYAENTLFYAPGSSKDNLMHTVCPASEKRQGSACIGLQVPVYRLPYITDVCTKQGTAQVYSSVLCNEFVHDASSAVRGKARAQIALDSLRMMVSDLDLATKAELGDKTDMSTVASNARIGVYHVVSSDLPPLAVSGAGSVNLLYTSKYDRPPHWMKGVQYKYVINRIAETQTESRLLDYLRSSYVSPEDILHIPLSASDIKKLPPASSGNATIASAMGALLFDAEVLVPKVISDCQKSGLEWCMIMSANDMMSLEGWGSLANVVAKANNATPPVNFITVKSYTVNKPHTVNNPVVRAETLLHDLQDSAQQGEHQWFYMSENLLLFRAAAVSDASTIVRTMSDVRGAHFGSDPTWNAFCKTNKNDPSASRCLSGGHAYTVYSFPSVCRSQIGGKKNADYDYKMCQALLYSTKSNERTQSAAVLQQEAMMRLYKRIVSSSQKDTPTKVEENVETPAAAPDSMAAEAPEAAEGETDIGAGDRPAPQPSPAPVDVVDDSDDDEGEVAEAEAGQAQKPAAEPTTSKPDTSVDKPTTATQSPKEETAVVEVPTARKTPLRIGIYRYILPEAPPYFGTGASLLNLKHVLTNEAKFSTPSTCKEIDKVVGSAGTAAVEFKKHYVLWKLQNPNATISALERYGVPKSNLIVSPFHSWSYQRLIDSNNAAGKAMLLTNIGEILRTARSHAEHSGYDFVIFASVHDFLPRESFAMVCNEVTARTAGSKSVDPRYHYVLPLYRRTSPVDDLDAVPLDQLTRSELAKQSASTVGNFLEAGFPIPMFPVQSASMLRFPEKVTLDQVDDKLYALLQDICPQVGSSSSESEHCSNAGYAVELYTHPSVCNKRSTKMYSKDTCDALFDKKVRQQRVSTRVKLLKQSIADVVSDYDAYMAETFPVAQQEVKTEGAPDGSMREEE